MVNTGHASCPLTFLGDRTLPDDRRFAQDGFSMAHIEKAIATPLGKSVSFAHLSSALGSKPQASSSGDPSPPPAQAPASEKK